jgi:hypothetical protein
MNEVLLKTAVEFIEDVRGNAKVLIKGGLDMKLLEKYVDVCNS